MNTLCNYDVILQVRLTEVRLTEDALTLHHMERRLTPQPQLTEVNLHFYIVCHLSVLFLKNIKI